jgi:hypothetical protein
MQMTIQGHSDMIRKCLIVASLVAVASARPIESLANNNLFLPGDAFFPTELTGSDVEALEAAGAGERIFVYSSFNAYPSAFCGYAGYKKAVMREVDDAFVRNLEIVYERMRAARPSEPRVRSGKDAAQSDEPVGMRVLFYPTAFDFPRYTLGLRYNENWLDEVLKFGHRQEHVRLCSLIQDSDALERDWRDAVVVPPLKARLPELEGATIGQLSALPVIIEEPVKAIVILGYTPKDVYDCERSRSSADPPRSIYIVDAAGIEELICESGRWRDAASAP